MEKAGEVAPARLMYLTRECYSTAFTGSLDSSEA